MNIKAKGTRLTKIKRTNFLSFIFILNFIFFIKKKQRIKKGNKIPICFKINKIGLIK